MAKFTAHSIVFDFLDDTGTPITPVTIGALTSTGHPLNTETTGDDSGGIYDEARSIVSQLPEPTYSTKSVQTLLSVIALNGTCFSSDGSHPGVRIYGQVVRDCKNLPAATANLRYTIPKGLLRLDTLSIPRTGDATVSFTVDALTDGTNAPFSGTYAGITLPTSPVSNKYGMGAARVGNILVSEPTNLSLAFGVGTDEKLPAVGAVWADTAGVRKVQPSLSIQGQDPTMLDDTTGIPMLGKQGIHTNTKIQLKKRLRGGAYELDASTVHMAMTLDGLTLVNDPFSSSGDVVADFDARLEGTFDGTNSPAVFLFNQAYSPTAA